MMRTKSQFSRNVYAKSDRIWCNKRLRHTTAEKYDNNGKGWYFRFDDDNNMSYKYILSITWTELGQLNTHNPIYTVTLCLLWCPVINQKLDLRRICFCILHQLPGCVYFIMFQISHCIDAHDFSSIMIFSPTFKLIIGLKQYFFAIAEMLIMFLFCNGACIWIVSLKRC